MNIQSRHANVLKIVVLFTIQLLVPFYSTTVFAQKPKNNERLDENGKKFLNSLSGKYAVQHSGATSDTSNVNEAEVKYDNENISVSSHSKFIFKGKLNVSNNTFGVEFDGYKGKRVAVLGVEPEYRSLQITIFDEKGNRFNTTELYILSRINEPPKSSSAKKIVVSLSKQKLYAYSGESIVYKFDCITGREGHVTDLGKFTIWEKNANYVSKTYKAPMPYAMFFTKDRKAIHGTPGTTVRSYLKYMGLWGPGSHGCVGLEKDNAKILFDWASKGTPIEIIE